jgi:hypothetical protein
MANAAKGSRYGFDIVWILSGCCAISGAGRRSNAIVIPSPAVARCGVSFCGHRSCTLAGAFGERIDEIAKPPAILAIANPNGSRDFSRPV